MSIDAREVARNGRLLCSLEDRSQFAATRSLRYQDYVSEIRQATVEQSGPVRRTIRIEGVHKAVDGSREWLPFVVRLYFYAVQEDVRVVHTIIFDGDHEKDFISALGLVFDVPLREQVHNRHVRFTGEGDGVWAESTQPVSPDAVPCWSTGRMRWSTRSRANVCPTRSNCRSVIRPS